MKRSTYFAAWLVIASVVVHFIWGIAVDSFKQPRHIFISIYIVTSILFVLLPAILLIKRKAAGWWVLVVIEAYTVITLPISMLVLIHKYKSTWDIISYVIFALVDICILIFLLRDPPQKWANQSLSKDRDETKRVMEGASIIILLAFALLAIPFAITAVDFVLSRFSELFSSGGH